MRLVLLVSARLLFLTDKILIQNGLIKKLEEGLAGSNIEIGVIFDEIPRTQVRMC